MTAKPTRRPAAKAAPLPRIVVLVEAPAWRKRIPDAAALVRRFARAAIKAAVAEGVPTPPVARPWTLTVVLGDDGRLQELNRDFRGKNKPTNVLSFPAWEGAEPPVAGEALNLGDIAVAFATTAAESRSQGKTLADHLAHLTVHGVLHLFGYDHLDKSQAEDMESLERAVLARFGIRDPYVLRAARKAAPRVRKPRLTEPGGRARQAARKRT
ncbi:MAG TPA: rRNA maturation RNase YbeY [Alphaproteobacteria bacterium]|jgi:probable rRNA maturation factor